MIVTAIVTLPGELYALDLYNTDNTNSYSVPADKDYVVQNVLE